MSTCETCAHWTTTDFDEGDSLPVRMSDREYKPEPGRWGHCLLLSEHSYKRPPELSSKRAFTQDASDYQSWLVTRSDFGCVEHTIGDAGATDETHAPAGPESG